MNSNVNRYRWVAAILALLLSPFTGMLYVGRGWRALGYLLLICAAIFVLPWALPLGWRSAYPFAWAIALLLIWLVGVADSYRIAARHDSETPLPWYSRWYGILLCLVFLLSARIGENAFLIEPQRMMGGGMAPTLLHGEIVGIAKYAYGLRLPYVYTKIADTGLPARWDVIIFRGEQKPSRNIIQRVIGVPGDVVEYRNKRLSVNEAPVSTRKMGMYSYVDPAELDVPTADQYEETADGASHSILIDDFMPTLLLNRVVSGFPFKENCAYAADGFVCKVPPGHYFTLQDNRDRAADGRYLGFVPASRLIGKVVAVGFNPHYPERSGTTVK